MLEKLGRAIFEKDSSYITVDFGRPTWEDLKLEPYRRDLYYIDLARAVIEALMEPTVEMACAGMTVMDICGNAPASGEVVPAYRAMLQSILLSKEEGEGR